MRLVSPGSVHVVSQTLPLICETEERRRQGGYSGAFCFERVLKELKLISSRWIQGRLLHAPIRGYSDLARRPQRIICVERMLVRSNCRSPLPPVLFSENQRGQVHSNHLTMGKHDKKTGKGRLDKFYKLAKEQGYRARSALYVSRLSSRCFELICLVQQIDPSEPEI